MGSPADSRPSQRFTSYGGMDSTTLMLHWHSRFCPSLGHGEAAGFRKQQSVANRCRMSVTTGDLAASSERQRAYGKTISRCHCDSAADCLALTANRGAVGVGYRLPIHIVGRRPGGLNVL